MMPARADAPGLPPAAAPPAPPPLVAHASSTARSSVVVSASFLAANVFGGLLALLIAVIVGEGPETDGFLAAYSAYLTFLLFGSTLRVALVPLFGATADEAAFRRRAGDTVARLVSAAAVMAGLLALSAPLLGRALVPSASSDAQSTAVTSVAVLAAAAWCQIWAAALAAVLAASRRFVASAALYAGASALTVALAAALMSAIGITGAAIAVAASAIVLLAAHLLYLRRLEFTVRPAWSAVGRGDTWRLVARAAAGAAIPVTFQVNLSIALAAVSARGGAVTGYTYAYLAAVMISGVTSATLGLTTMPQLVAALHERGRAVAREYLDAVSPFSVFVYVPVAAAYACFAHPLLEALLGDALTSGTLELLWDASRIFLLMALGWALLAPLTTLAFSLELFSGLALVSAVTIGAQVVLVLATRPRGAEAVAVAHALSGTLLVVLVLVLVFRREALAAGAHAAMRSLPAPALALVFPAVAALGLDGSVPAAIAGALLAGALYVGLSLMLWPAVARRALALLRR